MVILVAVMRIVLAYSIGTQKNGSHDAVYDNSEQEHIRHGPIDGVPQSQGPRAVLDEDPFGAIEKECDVD